MKIEPEGGKQRQKLKHDPPSPHPFFPDSSTPSLPAPLPPVPWAAQLDAEWGAVLTL